MTPKSNAATTAKNIVTSAAQKPIDLMIRINQILRAIFRAVKSTVGLLIILGIYSVIGAYLFRYLEGDEETVEIEQYSLNREGLLGNLTVVLQRGDLAEAHKLIISYEQQLKKFFEHGLNAEKMEQGPTWTFMGSLVYCITVYTTIGYGHIAPNTDGGRVATIIYALIGIPLCLIILADLGKLITRAIKFVWAFVRRFYYTGNCQKLRRKAAAGQAKFIRRKDSDEANDDDDVDDDEMGDDEKGEDVYEIDDEFNLPVPIALIVVLAYLFDGTFMYLGWEDWGYLEALYFVFISVSTIGFGDVLPNDQRMFFFSMFYIFIGLSLISMTINVFIEFFDELISNMKTKAGNFAKNRLGIDFEKIGSGGSGGSGEGSDKKNKSEDEVKLPPPQSDLTETHRQLETVSEQQNDDRDRSRSRSVSIENELEQTPDKPRSRSESQDECGDDSTDKSRSVSIEAEVPSHQPDSDRLSDYDTNVLLRKRERDSVHVPSDE
ncbi:TWiK family of potassium channels protein 18-like isoform X2 [Tubulanus polymorphus]